MQQRNTAQNDVISEELDSNSDDIGKTPSESHISSNLSSHTADIESDKRGKSERDFELAASTR